MKLYFLVVVLFAVWTAITAAPFQKEGMERGERHRRVTCDLLSSTGDAACAANCLSMGKAGGHCENHICVCRSDDFQSQWDKRFPEFRM